MKSIVVTGASGFLGGYVARHFDSLGWRVLGVGRGPAPAAVREVLRTYHRWSLPDPRFGELLRQTTPRLLVHCAGPSSVAESFVHPERDHVNGPGLVVDVLSHLQAFSPRTRFVLLSSAAVYGNPEQLPISEEQMLAPISPYGRHKMECEKLCRDFARDFGLATASVRIFSAYGPGLARQVVWDICRKVMTESEIVLQGTGTESRDFIHATDVAHGIQAVCNGGRFEGEAYNLAAGCEVTIAELAERALFHLGVERRVVFDGVLPAGTPRNWRADVSKARALGFTPSMTLDFGLASVAQWMRQRTLVAA
jgi:UDP-glucose 4-epimerase